MILGSMLKREPSSLKLTTNQYAKPSLDLPDCADKPYFNLSYSDNLILIGIHVNNPVGVDIERIRSIPEREELARKYFSWDQAERLRQATRDQKDRCFLQQWCRLESHLKATGRGFAEYPDRADAKQTCTHTWDLPLPLAYCGATSILLS
ncbi:MAG: 4'-phosphopantetheinyl transferase superfamily protein [Prochlorococcaceae cyanobacterium]